MKLLDYEIGEAATAGSTLDMVRIAARYMGLNANAASLEVKRSRYLIDLRDWTRIEIPCGDTIHILYTDGFIRRIKNDGCVSALISGW